MLNTDELLERTEARLAHVARRRDLQVAGRTFIVFHSGELALTPRLERCLEWVAGLHPEERRGMCRYRCEDLVRLGLADQLVPVHPRSPDNIRGNTGEHYLARVEQALVDPTWPQAELEDLRQGRPCGIVLLEAVLLPAVYG